MGAIGYILFVVRYADGTTDGRNAMTSPYLTLSKMDETFPDGCYKCSLKLFNEIGMLMGIWTVCTGQGWAQVFRKAGKNIPGSMEPLPQGTYVVHDTLWAGKKGDWSVSHGAGLGPVFIPIVCNQELRRGDFGIHMDFNRPTSPGTAGCVGITDQKDMKDIVKLLRIYDPKRLLVQWGL